MGFINRERELKTLEQEYRKKSSFVVIYGRRRAGKTTLIKEFIRNKPAIYFFADVQNEIIQIQRYRDIMAEFIKDEMLKNLEIKDWDTLFNYLLKNIVFSKKLILIFDEFQYLHKVNNNFSTILQRLWDEKLKNKNVMVILCGSLIGMMHQTVLNYNSPLYGRRTSQIRLQPVDFHDYIRFFSHKDITEAAGFYAVTGGIPKYIELFDKKKNVFANIREHILNKNSFLYEEPRFLLKDEVSETSTYFSILQVIADGNHKIGHIASRLQIENKNLTSFIERLLELDILERLVPVTEDNPAKSKKGLYFIKDNFFRFWFGYVYPYQSYLEIENTGFVMEKIRTNFNMIVSPVFEKIAMEMTVRNNMPFDVRKIGRWWDNKNEIDVVALGTKEILFGECKWSKQKIGRSILLELKEKAIHVKWGRLDRKEYFALYSRSGFKDDLIREAETEKNIILFDMSKADGKYSYHRYPD